MEFEWDEIKSLTNLRKHDVDFQSAVRIFDRDVARGIDDHEDYGEIREWAVGEAGGRILYVVFTMRGIRCRIISARKATKREREEYLRSLY